MLRKYLILIIVLAICNASVSCMQTPLKNAVQSKAGDELMAQILNEAGADYFIKMNDRVLGVEEPLLYIDRHYVYEYIDSKKNITIKIDADVFMPIESKLPVAKVEREEFNQDTVNRTVNLFTKGESVYETYLTIDMLEEQIILMKQRISEYDDNEKRTIKELESQLEYLINEIKNIDEVVQPADFNISQVDEIIHRQCLIDESVAQIIIDAKKNNPLGQSIRITRVDGYESINNYCEYHGFRYLPEELNKNVKLDIDEKTAIDIAAELIYLLGVKGMALYYSDIAIPSKYYWYNTNSSIEGGYIFEFRRNVNGVPSTGTIYIQEYMEGELGYSPIWKDEKIIVIVDNQGIIDFIWQSPTKVVEILNDDVTIMNFEDAINIATQQMSNSLWSHDGIVNQTLIIDKITLSLARIKIKDSSDEYMLIPVWKLYGDNWIEYTKEYLTHPDAVNEDMGYMNENGEFYKSNKSRPYLTINAIDGTIIDPYKGY